MKLSSLVTQPMERKKSIFCVANCFFLVVGVCSLICGIWLYLEKNDFVELTPSSFSALSAAGLCAFSGATIAIISAVGSIAVLIEGKCLLITYTCFVILLMLIQSVTGLTGFMYKESTREKIRYDLMSNINRSTATTRAGRIIRLNVSWDHLHESLECCGVDGYSDWYHTVQWPKNDFVPDSCCDPHQFNGSMHGCGKIGRTNMWFSQGCYGVFADWLFHHVQVVSALSLILLSTEVVVLGATFLVLCYKNPPSGTHTPSQKSRSRGSSYRYDSEHDSVLEGSEGSQDDEEDLNLPVNAKP
ncbi:tsp-21 [Pristionchus pacificus]|uniref:Tetraspanin n=1 Tax=Pristionchus pacificus TaxID=54126 RepID=A0A454Y3D9_PRIPA|nr:tsp-21 [Pristionchus pacificus]|eukprot:PDM81598.1 tsp-21 [Pristionchus pacificus]